MKEFIFSKVTTLTKKLTPSQVFFKDFVNFT